MSENFFTALMGETGNTVIVVQNTSHEAMHVGYPHHNAISDSPAYPKKCPFFIAEQIWIENPTSSVTRVDSNQSINQSPSLTPYSLCTSICRSPRASAMRPIKPCPISLISLYSWSKRIWHWTVAVGSCLYGFHGWFEVILVLVFCVLPVCLCLE